MSSASTPPAPRPDASMTLLTQIMTRPLDPGYEAAARARERAGLPAATRVTTATALVTLVVVGMVLAVSALALRTPSTAASRAKAALVKEIQARRSHGDQQSTRIVALRSEIDAVQNAALRAQSQSALAARLSDLELQTGAVPVTGPGIRITLDDAKSTGQGAASGTNPRAGTGTDPGRVIARDLQIVVNGLWQAGAEAVSVNGQRLTARSAIRFAGEAILVDYRPLVRPYVLRAIGDPQALPVEFADNDGGAYLHSLSTNYGIQSDLASETRMTLPAASTLSLRVAVPGPAPVTPPATRGSTTSTTSTTGTGR